MIRQVPTIKITFIILFLFIQSTAYSQNITALKDSVVKLFYGAPLNIPYNKVLKKLKSSKYITLQKANNTTIIIISGNPTISYIGEQARVRYFDEKKASQSGFDVLRTRSIHMNVVSGDSTNINKLRNQFYDLIAYFNKITFSKKEHIVHGVTNGVEDKNNKIGVEYFYYSSASSFLNDNLFLSISFINRNGQPYGEGYELSLYLFEDYLF